MRYILSLDAGTTSVRAIVFDQAGQICGLGQKEIRQIYPNPGWVEHDPQELWVSQMSVAVEALGLAKIRPRDIAAVGITNQRETTLLWERKTGAPVYNAIVWQDRRTSPLCDRLREQGHEGLIRDRTGLLLDAYFSATKVAWILENVPGVRAKAEAGELAFGTVDTWLIWNLTSGAEHVTDPSNASRTMLYNIHSGDWDPKLLEVFRVPREILPNLKSSSETYGEISTTLGLKQIPVAGVAGDQQAALFGQRCVKPGLTKSTYGTGCFMLQNIGTKPVASKQRLITTVAWEVAGKREFALEGSVFMGGAVVQWLRDGLRLVRSAQEVDEMAESVPDAAGVVLVPAFAGLGAPHWDAYARGTMIGLTRDTTAAHIARAALEGVAFQVADLLDAMRSDTGKRLSELRVDGGATRSKPLMQFQADILGVRVVRPAMVETTALGAAFLAGLAVGFWKSAEDLPISLEAAEIFEPKMSHTKAKELRGRWNEALSRAKEWEPKPTEPTKPKRKKIRVL